jgi:hypothetical protein
MSDLNYVKPGQFLIYSWKDSTGLKVRAGKIKKVITGTPYPCIAIDWDDGCNERWTLSSLSSTQFNVQIIDTEQEKLALLLKLT